MSAVCTIEGCSKAQKSRKLGLCGMHVERRRNGLRMDAPPRRRSLKFDSPPIEGAHFQSEPSGCWRWLGTYFAATGYGRVSRGLTAHRWVFESLQGEVPDGWHLDHLCRNHWCVNPDHLEPVTPGENARRGDHRWAVVHRTKKCVSGLHDWTPANVYTDPTTGWSRCRQCDRDRRRARRKAVAS